MRHAIRIEQHFVRFRLVDSPSFVTYYASKNKNFIQIRIIKHIN